MSRRQVIQQPVVMNNGVHNKYNCNGKPLVFCNAFNSILYIETIAEEIKIRKQNNAGKNNKIEIAFKIVIKVNRGFIIIGFQKKKQSHKKCEAGIIHKFKTAV